MAWWQKHSKFRIKILPIISTVIVILLTFGAGLGVLFWLWLLEKIWIKPKSYKEIKVSF